jgi:hypothetical protein
LEKIFTGNGGGGCVRKKKEKITKGKMDRKKIKYTVFKRHGVEGVGRGTNYYLYDRPLFEMWFSDQNVAYYSEGRNREISI